MDVKDRPAGAPQKYIYMISLHVYIAVQRAPGASEYLDRLQIYMDVQRSRDRSIFTRSLDIIQIEYVSL